MARVALWTLWAEPECSGAGEADSETERQRHDQAGGRVGQRSGEL